MKSIWDGWEKQCFGALADDNGAQCARGFICGAGRNKWPSIFEWERPEIAAAYRRVAEYVLLHHPESASAIARVSAFDFGQAFLDASIIVYANNVLKLTPDDFRRIDLLTQQEAAGMPEVQRLIESVPEPVKQ